jgi:hypothetical protein
MPASALGQSSILGAVACSDRAPRTWETGWEDRTDDEEEDEEDADTEARTRARAPEAATRREAMVDVLEGGV